MAVMQNSIIFGGIDSADFGIYIGGEGTFDAPKRDVEMISIPGRNGAFALDKGRFENIKVTYSAFNHEPDLATFSAQLEGFRNAICSQKGYQRLTDTFHPDEYRMAAYIDGLEIKPIEYNTAATFDIIFDCKPQRYLLSGEEAIDVSSGDTITNPTLFEAAPMLEVEGYGTIAFNGYEIELENAVMGDLALSSPTSYATPFFDVKFQKSLFNIGDTITLKGATINWYVSVNGSEPDSLVSISHTNNKFSTPQVLPKLSNPATTTISAITYSAGTNAEETDTMTVIVNSGGTNYMLVVETRIRFYTTQYISEYRLTFGATKASGTSSGTSFAGAKARQSGVEGYSTVSILGNPTYMDCDLGEVYMIKDGSPISLNAYVDLGSKLPTLAVGSNEVTYDNTITDLKLIPRWWKI